jgi:hypothetical protein
MRVSAVKMSFGKYRGQDVKQVPSSYLLWAMGHAGCLEWEYYAPLRRAIKAELRRRGDGDEADEAPWDDPAGTDLDVEAVCLQWFREMSKRWHPDRGGSDQAMAAVNDGLDRLRRLLDQAVTTAAI